jgi:hypothetical protein
MQPTGAERREFQRLHLNPPIPGSLGTTAVSILEIGVLGARVQHAARFDETAGPLRFSFGDSAIDLRCEIVRTLESQDEKHPGAGLESGLRFVSAIGDSGDQLRKMLGELIGKALEQRRAIPPGGFGSPVDGDKTVRGRDAEYLCYRLEDGVWTRKHVFLPEQPATGFTVAHIEDSEEMQRLCRIYQASDAEGRRLIRMFAELSVSEALQIPPQSQGPGSF